MKFLISFTEIYSKEMNYFTEYNALLKKANKNKNLEKDTEWLAEINILLTGINYQNTKIRSLPIPNNYNEVKEPIINYCRLVDEYIPIMRQYSESFSKDKSISDEIYDTKLLKKSNEVKQAKERIDALIEKYYEKYLKLKISNNY